MSEVITIEDDDLEEGEIADDVLPEPSRIDYSKPKGKELPRRYTLHEKQINSKHRKNCKHAGRHHRNKIKTMAPSTVHKKHHKSCPHRTLDKYKFRQLDGTKNGYSLESDHRNNHCNYSSSNSTIKCAFRNFSSPPRIVKAIKHNTTNSKESKNAENPSNQRAKEEFKDDTESTSSKNFQSGHCSIKCKSNLLSEEKINILPTKQNINESLSLETMNKVRGEGSEDEEELRRIALSTCLKLPVVKEKSAKNENLAVSSKLSGDVSISNPSICSHTLSENPASCDAQPTDNYEVIDMEIEDNESGNDEELFIIDTNPVISSELPNLTNGEFDWNCNAGLPSNVTYDQSVEKIQSLPSSQCLSNEDFEEELLRAEIIASMNSIKQIHQNEEKHFTPAKNKIQSPLVRRAQVLKKVAKSIPLYSKKPMSSFVNLPRKRIVAKTKLNYTKLASHKKVIIPIQRKVNTGPERIVITLNNDSSSDESDQEESNGGKGIQENNAVASIEALISDARQKSDIPKAIGNNLNTVSCLSKAQQEEYNSLKKILAEKQVLPAPSLTVKQDNNSSQLDSNILNKKIALAKENLEKEIKTMKDIEKELLAKKQVYMTSKLKVQHLKEQLHAAERTRAVNLELWKKSAAKLDIQKKTVLKHESLVNLLEKRLNPKSLQPEPKLTLSPVLMNNTLVT